MEITLTLRESDESVVFRTGDGKRQATVARPGTLWFCPIGVQEDGIRLSKPIPEALHIYLPGDRFADISSELGGGAASARSIDYAADVDDDVIRHIGMAIRAELLNESAAGRLLVESLAIALSTRLVHSHSPARLPGTPNERRRALDATRTNRVREFIAAHLGDELTIEQLASVACLSQFHFARAFRLATGLSPHRYVSQQRLERAKALLARSDCSFVEIAFASSFSSQASFNRAFRAATGVTPSEYRRLAR
jgi:AraC family transcriptional regulator